MEILVFIEALSMAREYHLLRNKGEDDRLVVENGWYGRLHTFPTIGKNGGFTVEATHG